MIVFCQVLQLLNTFIYYLYFIMSILYARIIYIYRHTHFMHAACLVPTEAEEGIRFAGIEVRDDCKVPCGLWELNSGHTQVQQVLLTTGKDF